VAKLYEIQVPTEIAILSPSLLCFYTQHHIFMDGVVDAIHQEYILLNITGTGLKKAWLLQRAA
jgi:hypothetical protein